MLISLDLKNMTKKMAKLIFLGPSDIVRLEMRGKIKI